MEKKIKGFEIIAELTKLTELIVNIETGRISYNKEAHDKIIKRHKEQIINSVQCL